MKGFPSREEVARIRKRYPEKSRVELIQMNDDPRPLKPGTKGTVSCVDDAGTVHVNWDNNRTIGVIPGVDIFKKINDDEAEGDA